MKASIVLVAGALATAFAVATMNADDKKPTESANKDQAPKKVEVLDKAPEQPTGLVQKTEEEWKKILTPEQYRILRTAGTERPNGEIYDDFKAQEGGTYFCAGCGAELFTSNEKFDSHCGWPSFYDTSKTKNVKYLTDYLLGYARTEVRCARCDGHLGHVFEGEKFDTPTDKRYCINGTVLKFVPFAANETAKKAEEKAKTETEVADAVK